MAGKKGELVPRPPKKSQYEIRFAGSGTEKGWRDLAATIRNAMADTWDFLTTSPLTTTPTNYRLKGDLATVERNGKSFDRWQHKPTEGGTARIWFYVDGMTVHLEQVHTNHPNATK